MKIIEINEQNIHLLFKGRARTATFKEAIVFNNQEIDELSFPRSLWGEIFRKIR